MEQKKFKNTINDWLVYCRINNIDPMDETELVKFKKLVEEEKELTIKEIFNQLPKELLEYKIKGKHIKPVLQFFKGELEVLIDSQNKMDKIDEFDKLNNKSSKDDITNFLNYLFS